MIVVSAEQEDYTRLDDRTIAGTALGTSPQGVAFIRDLQRATYDDGPAATAGAQASADMADKKADTAQGSANAADQKAGAAQTSADTAGQKADAAQARADAAYDLAGKKVAQNAGPKFAAPAGTVSRAALPVYPAQTAAAAYTQADVQALMDEVQALSRALAAVIVDLRGNGALTS